MIEIRSVDRAQSGSPGHAGRRTAFSGKASRTALIGHTDCVAAFIGRVSLVGAALLTAGLLAGCDAFLGEQDTDGYYRINPNSEGKFFGWTEISIDQDPYDVDRATLVAASLEARDGAGDLSYVEHVVGEVVTEDQRVPIVRGTDFNAGEVLAPLNILYDDDLRPLFVDKTIRIEWNGTVNPEHDFPENGYEVGVLITVDLE